MTEARRPASFSRRGAVVAGLSLAAHLALVAALLSAHFEAPKAEPDLPPINVQLVQLPRPPEVVKSPAPAPPSPAPPSAAPPAPKKPPPKRKLARPSRAPPPPDVRPLPTGKTTLADGQSDDAGEMSDAEVASAATAGSGGGGRGCDMAKRLQQALRRDRRVQSAVAEVHRGKALKVWNGDWVRHAGQEGAGLAAVRETIMWEVGFAPPACRSERVRGLILISLSDGPGAARLVLGGGDWRWSDVLFAKGAARRGPHGP